MPWCPRPPSMTWCWPSAAVACAATWTCRTSCLTPAWSPRHQLPCTAASRPSARSNYACVRVALGTDIGRPGGATGRHPGGQFVLSGDGAGRQRARVEQSGPTRALGGYCRHQQDAASGLGPTGRLGAAGQLHDHQCPGVTDASVFARRAIDAHVGHHADFGWHGAGLFGDRLQRHRLRSRSPRVPSNCRTPPCFAQCLRDSFQELFATKGVWKKLAAGAAGVTGKTISRAQNERHHTRTKLNAHPLGDMWDAGPFSGARGHATLGTDSNRMTT